jgi:hypothetical protein
VTTIYAFNMPKFVYIQLNPIQGGGSAPPTLRIRADTIEKGQHGTPTVLKLGTETVGEFQAGAVQGWWIQDEPLRT